MKPRGFTARFTCRALSTARQGLFYAFTFPPFSTLFKQRQKQGGPPLYVERSEAQQLFCPVFYFIENIKKQDKTKYKPGCPGLLNVT